MNAAEMQSFTDRAEQFYESNLRHQLEPGQTHRFVAVDPDAGEYFLGNTMSEAIAAARHDQPNRITHVIRVGHAAAIHFGMHVQ